MPVLGVPGAARPNGGATTLSPRGTRSTAADETESAVRSTMKSTLVPMLAEDGQKVKTSTHCKKRTDHPEVVGGSYALEKKLGEGSFGMVFRGSNTQTGTLIACKIECAKSPDAGQLENEANLLKLIASVGDRPKGFPNLLFFGVEGPWNCLVMDLLGMSIEDAMEHCKVMDVGSVCLIADRIFILLAYLHSKCIVHRDIKCENFMFGIGPRVHHLHMIDYGMSCEYWSGRRHNVLCRGQDLTGTARYASINSMKGYTQSRRDDLEAVGHMLIYLLLGNLPWSGLAAKDYQERLQRILYTKRTVRVEDLCRGLPEELAVFLNNARGMRFEKRPNYDGIRGLFRELRDKQRPPVQEHSLMWLISPESKLKVDPKILEPLDVIEKCSAQPEEIYGDEPEAPPKAAAKAVTGKARVAATATE